MTVRELVKLLSTCDQDLKVGASIGSCQITDIKERDNIIWLINDDDTWEK